MEEKRLIESTTDEENRQFQKYRRLHPVNALGTTDLFDLNNDFHKKVLEKNAHYPEPKHKKRNYH